MPKRLKRRVWRCPTCRRIIHYSRAMIVDNDLYAVYGCTGSFDEPHALARVESTIEKMPV